MKISRFFSVLLSAGIAILFLQSCGGEDIFSIDFSSVPPPYKISNAISHIELPKGVDIYVVEKGNGQFHVEYKDQIVVKYTGRTKKGKIFYSTYAKRFKGDTLSTAMSIVNLRPFRIKYRGSFVPPLIEGFRKGLYGMVPGEKRIIVVPPEMASRGVRFKQKRNMSLAGKTLFLNVKLVKISAVPRNKTK